MSRLHIVRALEALEDGDVDFAAELLRIVVGDDPVSPMGDRRCKVCHRFSECDRRASSCSQSESRSKGRGRA